MHFKLADEARNHSSKAQNHVKTVSDETNSQHHKPPESTSLSIGSALADMDNRECACLGNPTLLMAAGLASRGLRFSNYRQASPGYDATYSKQVPILNDYSRLAQILDERILAKGGLSSSHACGECLGGRTAAYYFW